MHITDDERPVPRDLKSNLLTSQKPSRPHPVDINGNVKHAPHPTLQKSQRGAPPDLRNATHTIQGIFTADPRHKSYHLTTEHDSDLPEGSVASSGRQKSARGSGDYIERPGVDEELAMHSRDTESLSADRFLGDQVCVY